jgi:hypothetical protein
MGKKSEIEIGGGGVIHIPVYNQRHQKSEAAKVGGSRSRRQHKSEAAEVRHFLP